MAHLWNMRGVIGGVIEGRLWYVGVCVLGGV